VIKSLREHLFVSAPPLAEIKVIYFSNERKVLRIYFIINFPPTMSCILQVLENALTGERPSNELDLIKVPGVGTLEYSLVVY